jgi:hypothetical protein
MAALSPAKAHHRAKIAALTRAVRAGERQPGDNELIEARRSLAFERLREQAEQIVADWPALTEQQIENVVAILRAGGGVDGVA